MFFGHSDKKNLLYWEEGSELDIISLYYFNELCEDMNMTHTASRLYISQQTLSNHILRLERHYGAPLFFRSPRLSLTDAGRIMRVFSKKILDEETQLKKLLFDVEDQKRGLLRFGASSMRINDCLPHVLPQFSREYPEVQLEIYSSTSADLEKRAYNRELDLTLCVLDRDIPALVSRKVLSDQIYLCVADSLLEKYYGDEVEDLKKRSSLGVNLADFAEVPFFMLSAANRLSHTISKCFEEADCIPNIYLSATQTRLGPSICANGLAACFMTRASLANTLQELGRQVSVFPLMYQRKPVFHHLFLVHHKKQYLPNYARCFVDLLTKYFEKTDSVFAANSLN